MKTLTVLIAVIIVGCTARATEARVHVFSSGENGIFANAYLVETEHSVVAIDATLLESTSKALREKLVALGKPLKAVLITHGHPDHYNGITNLIAGEKVDVVATAGTDRVIRESDAAKEKLWSPVFGAEWPAHRTFPNRILPDGGTLEVDGVKFTVHDLGPGESHRDSYWLVTDEKRTIAFIGDVVLNQVHAYVTDGHTAGWLKNIDRLEKELRGASRIHPGHGESGGLELLEGERRYLMEYRATVQSLAQGKPTLTEAQKQELTAHMTTYLPNQKLAFLIALGADPVAAELAARP
jgi:glyoxylase-like metal-dependent hydrolase (beta-lactamase superfamily II)